MAYATIADASANFQATTYTGNGGTQTITNAGNSNLKPDWLWVKNRSATDSHMLSDSTRGSTYAINSNGTGAQFVPTNGNVAFLTDGFSVGSNNNYNRSSSSLIAWQWKANGGTTSSNSSGSITSTVQANTAAGFSIVKWTGTGSNGTVGHGLGKAPSFILFKNYTATENWTTYHEVGSGGGNSGNIGGMYLNLTNGFNTASTWYQDTSPTSSLFYVGTNSKTNGGTMIAYCFTNIKGYQQAGQYYGNGNSTHGVFVNTGFRPAYVLIKRTHSGGGVWAIKDYRRPGHNQVTGRLDANDADAENVDHVCEFFGNGFRVLDSGSALNGSGEQYVYYAVADQSIVSTNNLPSNAGVMKAE
tara:strand:+ start:2057 stop:3130 length:1074 start_codon:yes stop_codon:yes gene_type:complete